MPLRGDTAFQAESGVHFPISSRSDKFRHLSFPFDSLQRRRATIRSLSSLILVRKEFLRAGGRFSKGRNEFSYGEKNSGSISRCSCGCRHASAQCEPLTMVAVQVLGNDHTVAFAGSQGNFQLNVYKPAMPHNVLTSIEFLTDAPGSFCDRCAIGIEPNTKRIREHLGNCLTLVTALTPHIDYEKAAKPPYGPTDFEEG